MKTTTKANTENLLKHLFDQMEKLDAGVIKVEEAKTQAALAKQANNVLKYELDRAATISKYPNVIREIEEH